MAAEDEDVDAATLQAQIDLSMAYVHDMVSAWVKPSSTNSVQKSSRNIEKEIQDSLRRPPRFIFHFLFRDVFTASQYFYFL
jgi:hypothetical protein